MWKEFKAFIMRGNVMDLAVGVIVGGAFGKIVTSFVNDVLMPPIGMLLGKVSFDNLFIDLSGTGYESLTRYLRVGAPVLAYGSFLNTVIDFLIMAFIIFLMVRFFNNFNKKEVKEEAPKAPTTKVCPYCMSEISVKATRCPHCTSQL